MDRLADAHELLDGPLDHSELAGNLRDLARVNRFLGGTALTWRALRLVAARRATGAGAGAAGPPMRMLDVGTGGADIPLALERLATRARLELEIVAVDVRPEIVALARQATREARHVSIDMASATALPYSDRSFDVCHASLVLHHLEPAAAIRLLVEMGRVAPAVIVNELDRRRRWLVGARLLAAVATTNRYTRHDAPLSVRRAYRPAELSELATAAGLRVVARLDGLLGHRYALVLDGA